jgi:hypothetical protein
MLTITPTMQFEIMSDDDAKIQLTTKKMNIGQIIVVSYVQKLNDC